MRAVGKLLSGIVFAVAAAAGAFFSLMQADVIWRSPPYYALTDEHQFAVPIMSMAEYQNLPGTNERSHLYRLTAAGGGEVFVAGIDHTMDENDDQLEAMRRNWQSFGPTVALVEGRLGFLFTWFQNPVAQYGEGGLTAQLAKTGAIPLYTWEPTRDDEIKILLGRFSPRQLALFYSLRPYVSNLRFGKPDDPDEVMQELIASRTDYDGIRGEITSVRELDAIWKADFPTLPDWRDTSDEQGWPKGYLYDIWDSSNQVRDIHLCSTIAELVNDGQRVFVTMGASHAVRIEQTLRAELGRS